MISNISMVFLQETRAQLCFRQLLSAMRARTCILQRLTSVSQAEISVAKLARRKVWDGFILVDEFVDSLKQHKHEPNNCDQRPMREACARPGREPLARRHGAPRLRLIFVGFLDDTTEKLAATLVGEIEQFLFQFFIVYLLCKLRQLLAHVPNKGNQGLVILVPCRSAFGGKADMACASPDVR